jgi:molybdate transport system ATP-binding protein
MALEFAARATRPIPLDLSFTVAPGQMLALVGHSGSGKSTILRSIAGLWSPGSARIVMDGTTWLDTERGIDLAPHRRRVGIVFQSYGLFPHMDALGNVMAAMGHRPRAARAAKARQLLEMVNLGELDGRRPAQMSGGQQQRVAVARALAREPAILLLDEPFSAVDRATREKLYHEVRELRRHLAIPAILVTHDIEEAQILADWMLVIERGRAVRAGPAAEIAFDPKAMRAMGLRDLAAHLPAVIEAQEADGLTRLMTPVGPIWLPQVGAEKGTRMLARIHAHDVMIARARPSGISALNVLPAIVADIAAGEGPGVVVRLDLAGHQILARITARSARQLELAPGVACYAVLKSMALAPEDID